MLSIKTKIASPHTGAEYEIEATFDGPVSDPKEIAQAVLELDRELARMYGFEIRSSSEAEITSAAPTQGA